MYLMSVPAYTRTLRFESY